MVTSIECPHCTERTFVDLPDDATGVIATHQTLRFRHRTTCSNCQGQFSYLTDADTGPHTPS